jgi:hypothetical protein
MQQNHLTIDLQTVKDLLNNLSEHHGDIDTDISIIESIVDGWLGNETQLTYLADSLIKMADKLIQVRDSRKH